MVVQDYLTISNQNKELQDELFYLVWFEYLMNYKKEYIREAYNKKIEELKHAVDADELRAAGYSEEDIAKAQL